MLNILSKLLKEEHKCVETSCLNKRGNSGPVKTKLSFTIKHSSVSVSYRGVNIKAGQMILYINQQKCSTV